jgi:chromosome segregation ATPase
MTKLSLAQYYSDYEELQQDYRTLERCVCEYKFRIASLQEDIEDKNDEIKTLRAALIK